MEDEIIHPEDEVIHTLAEIILIYCHLLGLGILGKHYRRAFSRSYALEGLVEAVGGLI